MQEREKLERMKAEEVKRQQAEEAKRQQALREIPPAPQPIAVVDSVPVI